MNFYCKPIVSFPKIRNIDYSRVYENRYSSEKKEMQTPDFEIIGDFGYPFWDLRRSKGDVFPNTPFTAFYLEFDTKISSYQEFACKFATCVFWPLLHHFISNLTPKYPRIFYECFLTPVWTFFSQNWPIWKKVEKWLFDFSGFSPTINYESYSIKICQKREY